MKITHSNILNALDIDRRKFLKSAGAIALLNCFWHQIEQVAIADAANRNVLFLFFPHRSPKEAEFFPTVGSRDADLKGVLALLNAFKSKMTVLGKMGGAMLSDYGHIGGNNATLTGAGQRGAGGGGVPYTPGAPSIIGSLQKHQASDHSYWVQMQTLEHGIVFRGVLQMLQA